jgi:hypothetical protein
MLYFTRYVCDAVVLPVVEGALAANGYARDPCSAENGRDPHAVVLSSGSTFVLLAPRADGDMAEIEVWGAGQSAAVNLLESLSIDLHRAPPPGSARARHTSRAGGSLDVGSEEIDWIPT